MTGSTDRHTVPSVQRVRVRNYKSLAECEVAFGPLTVLVGPNAAGKSNVLDALRFLADALTASPGQALSGRGGLDRVLHHRPDIVHPAESFEIEVCLRLAADGAAGPERTARYAVRIGRADQGAQEPPYAVRQETCQVGLGDDWEVQSSRSTDNADGSGILWDRTTGTPVHTAFRAIPPDRLALPVLAAFMSRPFRSVEAAITAMCFYELDTATLRRNEDSTERHTQLGPNGQHIGHVLGLLAESVPEAKESVDSYLRAVIPNALGADEHREGDSSSVKARFWTGKPGLPYWEAVNSGVIRAGDPQVKVFRRQALSEGTLRAAGVLTAAFQPGTLSGKISLVAVEEPEKAIHPSTVGALFEALHDASAHTQVIVTTQSSDFLDSESVDLSHLRIVEMRQGATVVGEVDEAARRYLREHPSQLPSCTGSGSSGRPRAPSAPRAETSGESGHATAPHRHRGRGARRGGSAAAAAVADRCRDRSRRLAGHPTPVPRRAGFTPQAVRHRECRGQGVGADGRGDRSPRTVRLR